LHFVKLYCFFLRANPQPEFGVHEEKNRMRVIAAVGCMPIYGQVPSVHHRHNFGVGFVVAENLDGFTHGHGFAPQILFSSTYWIAISKWRITLANQLVGHRPLSSGNDSARFLASDATMAALAHRTRNASWSFICWRNTKWRGVFLERAVIVNRPFFFTWRLFGWRRHGAKTPAVRVTTVGAKPVVVAHDFPVVTVTAAVVVSGIHVGFSGY
jgi:hypothetical protein